ncbi:MAG: bifunctional phosphopantothenoylcysteine decarboxylase/phosphopantothenate--cysteine ligase CoaBC, partial [candidate division WOR-3 bacterium]
SAGSGAWARPTRALLGVTGGIAAYKGLELLRLMRKAGWEVTVVMTRAACKFVGPESFRALSGRPVALELFPKVRPRSDRSAASDSAKRIQHVDLAGWAEVVVVAPATANIIGKLASGIADDLLSTILLAVPLELVRAGRVIIAPAMNVNMWHNPSVRRNISLLKEQGYRFVEPESGELACGTSGPGRLADVQLIFEHCRQALQFRHRLDGVRVTVTTGRTEEPLDPVRVITNRSSGLLGVEIARAFAAAGASVRLIAGPVSVPLPQGIPQRLVWTAEEMRQAVLQSLPETDILIMCAAVADYRPIATGKTKEHKEQLVVKLERTIDILKEVSRANPKPLVVGFSLDDSLARARKKLRAKRLEMIVANPLVTAGSDTIRPTLLFADGPKKVLPKMAKSEFALRLVAEVGRLYRLRR